MSQYFPPKSNAGYIFLKVVAATAVLAACLLLLAPTIASTSFGMNFILQTVNKRIKGNLSLEKASLHWLGSQEIAGCRLLDPSGEEIFYIKRLSCEAHLLYLLMGSQNWGKTEIVEPRVTMRAHKNGSSNLQQALSPAKKKRLSKHDSRSISFPFGAWQGRLLIEGGLLRLQGVNGKYVVIENVEAKVYRPSIQAASETFFFATTLDEKTSGDILLQATNDPATKTKDFSLKLRDLPLESIRDVILPYYPPAVGMAAYLLGPHLKGEAQGQIKAGELKLQVDMMSSRLKAQFQGDTKNGMFELSSKSFIELALDQTLMAYFFQAAAQDLPWALSKPALLQLQANLCRIPFPFHDIDTSKVAAEIACRLEQAFLESRVASAPSIQMEKMQSLWTVADGTSSVNASFLTNFSIGKEPSSLHLAVKTKQLPTARQTWPDFSYNFSATNFPAALLEYAFQLPPHMLPELFGSLWQLQASGVKQGKKVEASASILSPHLEARELSLLFNEGITLQKPSKIVYTPPKSQLKKDYFFPWRFSKPITIHLKKAHVPVLPFDEGQATFVAQAECAQAYLLDENNQALYSLRDFSLDLSAPYAAERKLRAEAVVKPLQAPLFLQEMVREFHTTLQAAPYLEKGSFISCPFTFNARSEQAKLTAQGKVDRLGAYLLPSVQIEGTIDEKTWRHLANQQDVSFSKSPFLLRLENVEGMLQPFSVQDFTLKAEMKDLSAFYQKERFAIHTLYATCKKRKDAFDLSFIGDVAKGKKLQGTVSAVNARDFQNANYTYKFQADALPLAFLQAFMPLPLPLPTLFGNHIQGKLNGQWSGAQDRGFFDLAMTGDGLDVQASFDVGADILLKKTPARITWVVRPERFAAIQKMVAPSASPTPFRLALPSTLRLEINALEWSAAKSHKRGQLALDAEASINEVQLIDSAGESKLLLSAINFLAQAPNLKEGLQLSSSMQIEKQNEKESVKAELKGHCLAKDFIAQDGSVFLPPPFLQGELTGENLPLPELMRLFGGSESSVQTAKAYLSSILSGSFALQLNEGAGPLSFHIASPVCQMHAAGMWKNGSLFLREPLSAAFELTPALSAKMLQMVNPLLITAIRSNKPLQLSIDHREFELPLFPFSLEKTKAFGTLDLHQVQLSGGGAFQLFLSFLQASPSAPDGLSTLWATPIYFRLQNGQLEYQRMDGLINQTIHMASWGNVHLLKNRLNMSLAIDKNTLEKSFFIKNLPPDYFFIIPIKGTLDKPEIDWKAAAARVAALAAKNQSDHSGGGVLEDVWNFFQSVFDDQKSLPPPTTFPFPWQKRSPTP